jgi:hypothetical protein
MHQYTEAKAERRKSSRIQILVVAAVLASLCLCVSAVNTHAQARSNAVIDQMIEALGGQAFLDTSDIHTTGRFYAFTRGQLSAADVFADYIKFPDMERTEFGILKNKEVTINRGKEGWKVPGKKEPLTQTPGECEEFLKGFKTSLDYVLRFDFKDRQTTVQSLPTEILDFKRADVVELRDPSKNKIVFYIDRETHLPIKMEIRRNDDAKVRKEEFANWHKFEGLMVPLYMSRYIDGVKTMEVRTETAVFNSGLSDSLFAQPK